jgi:hypothetical protein
VFFADGGIPITMEPHHNTTQGPPPGLQHSVWPPPNFRGPPQCRMPVPGFSVRYDDGGNGGMPPSDSPRGGMPQQHQQQSPLQLQPSPHQPPTTFSGPRVAAGQVCNAAPRLIEWDDTSQVTLYCAP